MRKGNLKKMFLSAAAAVIFSAISCVAVNAVSSEDAISTDNETANINAQQSSTYPEPSLWDTELLTYTIENGEATITGLRFGNNLPNELIIPENIMGTPVTAIKEKAFIDCVVYNESSVKIPKTVKYIGEMAFGYTLQVEDNGWRVVQPVMSMDFGGGMTGTVTALYGIADTESYIISGGLKIYGYKGTAAEEYSKNTSTVGGRVYGFEFISLGDVEEPMVTYEAGPAVKPYEVADPKVTTNNYKEDDSTLLYGDVNMDARVTPTDVIAFMRHFLGVNILKGNALRNADVTGDGEVDVRDLSTMKQFFMGDKISGGLNEQYSGDAGKLLEVKNTGGEKTYASAELYTDAAEWAKFRSTDSKYGEDFFKENDMLVVMPGRAHSTQQCYYHFHSVNYEKRISRVVISVYDLQNISYSYGECDCVNKCMLIAVPKGTVTETINVVTYYLGAE